MTKICLNKKDIALLYMQKLGLKEYVKKAFYEENIVHYSVGRHGNCKANDVLNEWIKEIEKEHDILIYYVIKSTVTDGVSHFDLYDFLYVSKFEEEWEDDLNLIDNGDCKSYSLNERFIAYSGFDDIPVILLNNSVLRVFI